MGKASNNALDYLLLIKDDLSSFVWLYPTKGPTADAAVDSITMWISSYGLFEWLVTDQGTHFTSKLMKLLNEELHTKYHFTEAYCPWANGTIERVCREVLRATKALLSEMKLPPTDWPSVSECSKSVLSQAPLPKLGLRDKTKPGIFRTPLEVFTGHTPRQPLLRALPIEKHEEVESLDEAHAR